MSPPLRTGLCLLVCLPLGSGAAAAADHTNLDEGLPLEITDAYPLEYPAREAQLRVHYEYTPEGDHELLYVPRFELGFPRNAQLGLEVPFLQRNDDSFEIGRVRPELFYNLNQETLTVPALSLAADAQAPTGPDAKGFDPGALVVLTKAIPGGYWHRLHLNGHYTVNLEQRDDERPGMYRVALGYDFRLGSSATAIIDAVRREEEKRDEPAMNFGEIGIRYSATPLLVFSAGAGGGMSDDEDPFVTGTLALQYLAF